MTPSSGLPMLKARDLIRVLERMGFGLLRKAKGSHWSLFDLVTMELELTEIVGRKVDLVSRRGIEQSRNPLRRQAILQSAELYYAA